MDESSQYFEEAHPQWWVPMERQITEHQASEHFPPMQAIPHSQALLESNTLLPSHAASNTPYDDYTFSHDAILARVGPGLAAGSAWHQMPNAQDISSSSSRGPSTQPSSRYTGGVTIPEASKVSSTGRQPCQRYNRHPRGSEHVPHDSFVHFDHNSAMAQSSFNRRHVPGVDASGQYLTVPSHQMRQVPQALELGKPQKRAPACSSAGVMALSSARKKAKPNMRANTVEARHRQQPIVHSIVNKVDRIDPGALKMLNGWLEKEESCGKGQRVPNDGDIRMLYACTGISETAIRSLIEQGIHGPGVSDSASVASLGTGGNGDSQSETGNRNQDISDIQTYIKECRKKPCSQKCFTQDMRPCMKFPSCRQQFKDDDMWKRHQQDRFGINFWRCLLCKPGEESVCGRHVLDHIHNKHSVPSGECEPHRRKISYDPDGFELKCEQSLDNGHMCGEFFIGRRSETFEKLLQHSREKHVCADAPSTSTGTHTEDPGHDDPEDEDPSYGPPWSDLLSLNPNLHQGSEDTRGYTGSRSDQGHYQWNNYQTRNVGPPQNSDTSPKKQHQSHLKLKLRAKARTALNVSRLSFHDDPRVTFDLLWIGAGVEATKEDAEPFRAVPSKGGKSLILCGWKQTSCRSRFACHQKTRIQFCQQKLQRPFWASAWPKTFLQQTLILVQMDMECEDRAVCMALIHMSESLGSPSEAAAVGLSLVEPHRWLSDPQKLKAARPQRVESLGRHAGKTLAATAVLRYRMRALLGLHNSTSKRNTQRSTIIADSSFSTVAAILS